MRTYERNGVHVDQCSDCRGIFLDRGELERLIDAENAWHVGQAEPPRRDERPYESSAPTSSHETSGQQPAASGAGFGAVVGEVLRQVQGSKSSSHHRSDYAYKKRKKESFLSDLFG
jgi:hypothetical protein